MNIPIKTDPDMPEDAVMLRYDDWITVKEIEFLDGGQTMKVTFRVHPKRFVFVGNLKKEHK